MRTRDSNKEQVVKEKAIGILVKDGFEGFSMNKLARACGISVATLYIYYQDKEDLIKKLGVEIGEKFFAETLNGFSTNMSFRDGLKKQWENRARYALKYPTEVACYEIIRHSTHGEYILSKSVKNFREVMGNFFHGAIKRKELVPISEEIFWSVAYGSLYSLLRFHTEGKNIAGKPFTLSKKMMNEAFELTLKALTPQ